MRHVKIHFELVPDADGYPPVAVESLWAQPGVAPGEFVIDNIPFFVRDATLGDTVLAREADGDLWFVRVVSRSRHSLVRAIFFDEGAQPRVRRELEEVGCTVEYAAAYKLLSVGVPDPPGTAAVRAVLDREADAGTLGYEEPILRD